MHIMLIFAIDKPSDYILRGIALIFNNTNKCITT